MNELITGEGIPKQAVQSQECAQSARQGFKIQEEGVEDAVGVNQGDEVDQPAPPPPERAAAVKVPSRPHRRPNRS